MDPSQSLLASRLNHLAISLLEMNQFELAYETFRDAYQGKGNLEAAVKRLRSGKESGAPLGSSTTCGATFATYSSLFLQILSSTTQSIEITIERAKHKFQRAKSDKTIVNLPVIRFCGNEEGITSEIVQSILAYNMAVATSLRNDHETVQEESERNINGSHLPNIVQAHEGLRQDLGKTTSILRFWDVSRETVYPVASSMCPPGYL